MIKRSVVSFLMVLLCIGTVYAGGNLVRKSGVQGGLIVHIGCGDGAGTAQMRINDSFLVHGLCEGNADLVKARRTVAAAGEYGDDFVIHKITRGHLPYIDNLVNLIICDKPELTSKEEILRVLAPEGKALIKKGGSYTQISKKTPDNTDEWTHYLHSSTGNAVADDRAVGAPRHMQWWATPRWLRSHHNLASISSVVTAGGRLFYIMDEAPAASMAVPGKWSVIARNAYNGLQLWKVDIPTWANTNIKFRSGPTQLTRLLVTDGKRVFLPLGISAPVSALDVATGKELMTFKATDSAEEILYHDGTLIVMCGIGDSEQFKSKGQAGKKIVALNVETGNVIWEREFKGALVPVDQTIATDGKDVCFQIKSGVITLDYKTGATKWQYGGAKLATKGGLDSALMVGAKKSSGKKGKKKKGSAFSAGFYSTLVMSDGVVLSAQNSKLAAVDLKTGKKLWETAAPKGFRSPPDVLVVNGLVWVGPNFVEGLDLRTGEAKKQTVALNDIRTSGHHHRCYREKATTRYLFGNYRGIELFDLEGDDHGRNNWVRGLCQYGIMPANGILYAPSHACGCFMEAKLEGFWALAPQRKLVTTSEPQLIKGSAYGSVNPKSVMKDAWPMLRSNSLRNGSTDQSVSENVSAKWDVKVGDNVTPPVIAGSTVLVADIDTHQIVALDAGSGAERWRFTAGGRIDSSPTICGNVVVFGSADGYVYCITLADGKLAWSFRAAPVDQKTVSEDQLESVWPVHGSVMVEDGVAYFAAGRSSYIDGGIHIYALDVKTGEIRSQKNISSEHAGVSDAGEIKKMEQNATDGKTHNAPDKADAFSMEGAKTDIFVSNGENVFMRQMMFDRNLNRKVSFKEHLFSTSTLLDDSENHRSHWMLGSGDFSRTGVAYSWIANADQRRDNKVLKAKGIMLSYDGDEVWAVDRMSGKAEGAYRLVKYQNTQSSPEDKHVPDFVNMLNKDKFSAVPRKWEQPCNVRPRSIIKTRDKLLIGGIPDYNKGKDLFSTITGEDGGSISFVSINDGGVISEVKFDKAPVWDGVAVANGAVFVTTIDGKVRCLK